MSMGTSLIAVQTAVYAVLTSAGLTVYDDVPENAAGPYVALGDTDIEKLSPTFGRDGRMLDYVIRVWSQAFGWNEALQIAGTIITNLHNKHLTLVSNTHSYTLFNDMQQQRDPDGIWRQAILHFDMLVEE